MVDAVAEEITETLTCLICMELYEDPKILKCGHSYCKVCLQNHGSKKKQLKHILSLDSGAWGVERTLHKKSLVSTKAYCTVDYTGEGTNAHVVTAVIEEEDELMLIDPDLQAAFKIKSGSNLGLRDKCKMSDSKMSLKSKRSDSISSIASKLLRGHEPQSPGTVRRLAEARGAFVITCPLCLKTTILETGKVEELPTNYAGSVTMIWRFTRKVRAKFCALFSKKSKKEDNAYNEIYEIGTHEAPEKEASGPGLLICCLCF
ncbi:unnamed protein product [Owenia fusiformis]|uniref:RING-type domain-containing protein n=1 Tax=Owenia fusiformis TaxID=6347 RepID=A0A8S4P8M2_OWEFU|nr:unnamed protein product [Owenia fusiformis]